MIKYSKPKYVKVNFDDEIFEICGEDIVDGEVVWDDELNDLVERPLEKPYKEYYCSEYRLCIREDEVVKIADTREELE